MSEKVVQLVEQLVSKVLTGSGDVSDNPKQLQKCKRMTKYAMRVLGSRIMPSVESDEFHVSASIKRKLQIAQVSHTGINLWPVLALNSNSFK